MELASFRGLLREAIARLKLPELETTMVCLELVRDGLARTSRLPLSPKLATTAEWRTLDRHLGDIVDALRQRAAVQPNATPLELAPFVGQPLETGARLARMQAVAEVESSGE